MWFILRVRKGQIWQITKNIWLQYTVYHGTCLLSKFTHSSDRFGVDHAAEGAFVYEQSTWACIAVWSSMWTFPACNLLLWLFNWLQMRHNSATVYLDYPSILNTLTLL